MKTNTTQSTPITDAAVWDADLGNMVVDRDVASRLEHDRARLLKALKNIHGLISSYPKAFNAHEVNLDRYMEDAGALLHELSTK